MSMQAYGPELLVVEGEVECHNMTTRSRAGLGVERWNLELRLNTWIYCHDHLSTTTSQFSSP